jgi:hypothetical protein
MLEDHHWPQRQRNSDDPSRRKSWSTVPSVGARTIVSERLNSAVSSSALSRATSVFTRNIRRALVLSNFPI